MHHVSGWPSGPFAVPGIPVLLYPLSTLMPGIMPAFVMRSTILLPSLSSWYSVSVWRMTPEMYAESPGAV